MDKAPWTASKAVRRAAKHSIYLVLSAAIAHLFLAYFVSIPSVWGMMRDAPTKNWGAFVFIAAATGGVYFNFAWFREQLCIVICPYGRLQSALTDDHTLVIGYDQARGEPRGKPGALGVGDCVACDRCVSVCPTGIDIRHGLQLECIGCAACIDACDEVMKRVGRPQGLVRYDSLAGFARRKRRWIRPRTLVYGVLLLAGASVAGWSIGGIRPAVLGVTRMIGAPYYIDGDVVRNQFLVRLVNKRSQAVAVTLSVRGLPPGAAVRGLEEPVEIPAMGEEVRPLIVQVPRSQNVSAFTFEVDAGDLPGSFKLSRSMEFLGPEVSPSPPGIVTAPDATRAGAPGAPQDPQKPHEPGPSTH
jgi:cytochrome c oxidase accessory protein FixG